MQNQQSSPPKPITDVWSPELVALPRLTFGRRLFRQLAHFMTRLIIVIFTRPTVTGFENFPKKGPALVVINHLGDADVVLVGAYTPIMFDGLGKIELRDHWFAGPLLRAYGIIWVHRGRPDRKAIRAALDGLAEGRIVGLAPEGRQSVTGRLEEGNEGAAFLALKSGAPIVPIAMTGTENENIYGHIRSFRRARVTLKVGKPFFLRERANRQEMLRDGTRQIMESLAELLPESYRGSYKIP